jgi:hypothetical protein
VTAKRDPDFTAPLFLIPTAINYDRVLEDRNLTEELLGKEDRSTRGEKLHTSFDFLFKNFWRGVFGRFKRYGYAIVSFGSPVSVDQFIETHPQIVAAEFADRKPHLQALAETVMAQISEAFPVTPVTLAARAFATTDKPLTDGEIASMIDRERNRLWLLREKRGEEVWSAARRILEIRRLIEPAQRWRSDLFEGEGVPVVEDAWQWNPNEILLRDYYANALLTFAEVKQRGWPEPRAAASLRAG